MALADLAKQAGSKPVVFDDEGKPSTQHEVLMDRKGYHGDFLRLYTALTCIDLLKDRCPSAAAKLRSTVAKEHLDTAPSDLKAVWLQALNWEAQMGWEDFIVMITTARKDFKKQDTILTWNLSSVTNAYTESLHAKVMASRPAYDGKSAAGK